MFSWAIRDKKAKVTGLERKNVSDKEPSGCNQVVNGE